MVQNPKYVVKSSTGDKIYWILTARNGEPILKSQMYVTKQGAVAGIQSSRLNVADRNFNRLTASNGQYYFNQVAGNGEIIGTSEMYTSTTSRETGIQSVKTNAPVAAFEDLTVKVH
ncbi:MAG: YegP family protein [Sediminibacterium sp.]